MGRAGARQNAPRRTSAQRSYTRGEKEQPPPPPEGREPPPMAADALNENALRK